MKLAVLSLLSALALVHAHNDYQSSVPFYMAYAFKADVIECDMHYIEDGSGGGAFLVGHDAADLDSTKTFESMYLEPLVTAFRCNGGCAWRDEPERRLTLMVEIKTKNPDAYVDALHERLSRYPDVFDPEVNPRAVGILITGWEFPAHKEKYPEHYLYDYQYNGVKWDSVTPDEAGRIGSISMNFGALSRWKGRGEISAEDLAKVQKVIDFAHSLGKSVRFWGAPDCEECWLLLASLGADYISTDRVAECSAVLRKEQ